MSEPILVLNCGSSSIKFAVLDASVEPLPRKSAWSGRIEGIGSENPTLVDGNAAPLAVALDARAPYHAALQRVRSCVERRTGGRPPAVIAHRVVHGRQQVLGAGARGRPRAGGPRELHSARAAPPAKEWMAAHEAVAAVRAVEAQPAPAASSRA